jgi:hypothetical protein
VVDAKRLCWATSCSAGCFEDLEDSSTSMGVVGPLRSRRLKTQGPSGRGWMAAKFATDPRRRVQPAGVTKGRETLLSGGRKIGSGPKPAEALIAAG